MEKEFVPYNEALALKELGFDEPCFAFYNGKFLDFKIQGGDICSPYLSTENRGECSNTPLYQQAFRWFREQYHLISYIYFDFDDMWCFKITENKTVGFTTYEEAELACLRKLIEIVKSK